MGGAVAGLIGSDALFRLLVEHVADYAIFMLDPNGRVLSWNDGAERIKGYRADEIIGEHFSIFYDPEDVARGHPQEMLRRALADGRCEEESWRVRKDGTRFWASVVVTVLHSDDGELLGFAKVTRDLTERKRIEDERIALLANEIRERDAFLSIAAHELRTPLAGAKVATQLLMRRLGRADKLEQSLRSPLEILERQIDKVVLLVTHLLEAGKVQTDKVSLELAPHDLSALVNEVATTLAAATGRRIDVIGPVSLRAAIDPFRLEQVILNLLDNAVKHSERDSPIEVTLAQPDGATVEISIRDHGVGVLPEQRARLFERYYQAHPDRSGMGLGLYISRVIAREHGGTITAEFPSDGGSRFVVSLLASAEPTAGMSSVGGMSQLSIR